MFLKSSINLISPKRQLRPSCTHKTIHSLNLKRCAYSFKKGLMQIDQSKKVTQTFSQFMQQMVNIFGRSCISIINIKL